VKSINVGENGGEWRQPEGGVAANETAAANG
jgi:hypothetical protein